MSDESQQSHTADDLLADAHAAGTPLSKRLIVDWVAKGLLDHPRRRGLGRGKGQVATWPEGQRMLFRVLVVRRNQDLKRLADLCNVPVMMWLYPAGLGVPLGAEFVPLSQVRRCLRTWAATKQKASVRGARQMAERLIEQHGMPNISRDDRGALIGAVVRGMTGPTGGGLDEDSLYQAARQAFTSEHDAKNWAHTVGARYAAVARLESFDDDIFETARLIMNQGAAIEQHRRLANAAANEHVGLTTQLANELSSDACLGLVTTLGFLELARQQQPTIPDKSAPRLREQTGASTPKERPFDAEEHATARQRTDQEEPPQASSG